MERKITAKDITRTAKFGAMIPSSMLINDLPPAFSRLPPDGHEFPPNFIEPIILSQVDADMLCKHSNTPAISDKVVNGYNNNSDKIPELPKTVPPPVPRKSNRQSADMFGSKDEQRSGSDKENNSYAAIRNSFNNLAVTNGNGASPLKSEDAPPQKRGANNWRKDEKSEKSVRDKIAMFSNGSESPKFASQFAKSTECLDAAPLSASRKYSHDDFSRTRSVESLDEVDRGLLPKPERTTYEAAYRSKFMVEKSKPVPVLEKAFSVESLSNDIIPPPASYGSLPRKSSGTPLVVSRRTSFSGPAPEERKASVNNLLEQRKRSISKLRGLVIPEKVPESDVLPHMPVIKSKDCEKINAELLPKLEIRSLASYARRASVDSIPTVQSQQSKPYVPSSYRAMLNAVHGKSTPPAKPPRSAIPPPPPQRNNDVYRTDESEDSDSLLSRRSTPPVSPAEKLPLTRTLSSETNVSVTSSNSTLTSGSGSQGSQASCSSSGSTPTVDMSRRVSKSSSEQSMNRKNILALSKSRNGKYDTGDSTEEEDNRRPMRAVTSYKLVQPTDSLESKSISIAQYVEVVDEEEKPLPPPKSSEIKIVPKIMADRRSPDEPSPSMTDLAKWVRSEAAKSITTSSISTKKIDDDEVFVKKYSSRKEETKVEPKKTEVKRDSRFSEPKKLNLSEIRKTFEVKATSPPAQPNFKVPVSPPLAPATKDKVTNGHDRFSSWDSVASSSSGVSSMQTSSLINGAVSGSTQNLQGTPSEFGSFSSLGSSHSLITPQDLQLLVEEADPPLQTPDAFVIVLQRDTPESSIGITLAGGSDYETKEITIHKILTNSPTDKDGRLKKGDRILSINGLSMRGLTHRESLTVLKTPRQEVVLVVTRSKSLPQSLNKSKLGSLGSLCSLADKSDCGDFVERKMSKNKGCRSLDLDLELISNEDASISISASEDGQMSNDEAFSASDNVESPVAPQGHKVVELMKDGAGLGFSIEGGFDSPNGDRPLTIKKIFMGGVAEKSGKVNAGDEIISINEHSVERMTRIEVWNMMKRLPNGPVRILFK